MKWTLTDTTTKKITGIPCSSITGRNSGRFLSALLRYAMRRRKLSRDENNQTSRPTAFTERISSGFGGIDSHRARRLITPLSKEELSAIQFQLAILSDGDGDRPIHVAIANEDLKMVQKLCQLMLKNKISLDIRNYLRQTPLHLAVIVGNIDIIQTLLSFGASPTVCDRNGNTVLHLCVKSHSDEAVLQHLLSYSQVKDILNSMDYEGYSTVHYAVFKRNPIAVKILKMSGADMDKTDGKSGRTALIYAVLDQNVDMVKLLLNSDASPHKMDYSGRSAIDIAIQIGNKPIIQLLERSICRTEATSMKERLSAIHPNATVKRTKN